jgi:L-lactate dehydrogenase
MDELVLIDANNDKAVVLDNEGVVLNVSTYLDNYLGISDVYLSVPCVIDRSGVRQIFDIDITENEHELLNKSADKLKGVIRSLES